MKCVETKQEDMVYTLLFEERKANQLIKATIIFKVGWTLVEDSIDFREAINTFIKKEEQDFPYDLNKDFKQIPIHIPDDEAREIFKACFDYFIRVTKAPVVAANTKHPGYPLTLLTYNPGIIEKEEVHDVIESILYGIKQASIIYETIEAEKEDIEDEDEVDENVTVEFEEDDELKRLMKQPAKTEFLPMEGE